jgi:hypothetical protein
MPEPVCKAPSTVGQDRLKEVQTKANQSFKEADPIRDAELLSESEWQQRSKAIADGTGLKLTRYELSSRIINHMELNGVPYQPFRTSTNVSRLVQSHRVETSALVQLIRATVEPANLSEFYEQVQKIFLGAKLFFYERVPEQGAVLCYMPKSSK